MSRDAAILARAILPLTGRCRVCSCGGDECSLPEGGRCVWMDGLRTLCSNPRCVMAAANAKKRRKREEKRSQKQAAHAEPFWMKRRREEMARKRRGRKTKGRAA